jgi:hypothetical protein
MKKCAIFSAICATVFYLSSPAQAVPIPGDLAISGTLDFDNSPFGGGASSVIGDAMTSGSLNLTAGGATSTTTFDGLTVMGADPLMGNLTMTGDGLNVTGTADARNGDTLALEVLGDFSTQNNSGTDMYKITFQIDFSGSVTATGADAAMEVEFDVGPLMSPSDIASYEVLSDTIGGNRRFVELDLMTVQDDGMGLGGLVTLNHMATFDVTLNPGASFDFTAFWSWTSLFSTDIASGDFDISLSILSVENLTNPDGPPRDVPAPAGLGLFALALSGLFAARRRKVAH